MADRTHAVRLRSLALAMLLLGLLFFVFFDRCKHVPALEAVNPFGEDPYDGVGSFGVQLAAFAAILSLLRAFRPYASAEIPSSQAVMILRSSSTVVISVGVTLLADAVALLRNPSVATASPAGSALAGLVGGMASLTALAGWEVRRTARALGIGVGRGPWRRAMLILLAGTLVLALYPAAWRRHVSGVLLTAALGGALLLLMTWALATAAFPGVRVPFEDLLDDAQSICRRLGEHRWHRPLDALERIASRPGARAVLSRLNPRARPWIVVISIALVMGLAMVTAEAVGEGLPAQASRVALVVAVFIGLEGAGVLLGYALLSRFLGIFRHE